MDTSNSANGTCTNNNNTYYCPSNYDWSRSNTAKRFETMRDAITKQNRTILYSLCEWGDADVNSWGKGVGNSWRSTGDINRKFPNAPHSHQPY
jgi:alpha-galactosidase